MLDAFPYLLITISTFCSLLLSQQCYKLKEKINRLEDEQITMQTELADFKIEQNFIKEFLREQKGGEKL